MMQKAWSSREDMPYCFSSSSVKFWGHSGQKIHQFWPKFGVSGLLLQFEFTNDFEMMHEAWHSVEEAIYCFLRSSMKFPGHMDPKISNLNPILCKNTRPVAAIKSLRFAMLLAMPCSYSSCSAIAQLISIHCRIYVTGNWASIGSGYGLSPVRHQAITWTSADLLSIELLGTNFSETGLGILIFSFKIILLKMSSATMAAIVPRGEMS